MGIETDIFLKFKPVFEKLKNFGFKKSGKFFTFETDFLDNHFKAVINISPDGKVTGQVFDKDNNEEFLPIKIKNSEGSFVGKVRESYEKILINIREQCFEKQYFIFPQTNRIAREIIKQYKTEPEFLWENLPDYGIFRNKESKKWFALFGDIDRSKIQKGNKGKVEILNIKLSPDNVQTLSTQPHFYTGYHMNKKFWVTIILDESVSDEKVMELIYESYNLSCKNKHKTKKKENSDE